MESFEGLYKALEILMLVMGPKMPPNHKIDLQSIATAIDELEPFLKSSINDIPTLQAYILVTLLAHLSGLHSRAEQLRILAVIMSFVEFIVFESSTQCYWWC
ncbi:hypothetical protein NADFUDRAFT_48367 [Nadsonia fulvescens var. elongata DSM 6958]|uniref:Uncharacterized protein n=1 Tax=Nadsonia fulvescens var. elongata DSM 6958 TaxID=857566 RepID=A0A1E3PRW4_9ASCO|nr:hypothetical protein NADFUDRAFT_48367 [Nadsonia fulvescens var. elongata DSM 6958]